MVGIGDRLEVERLVRCWWGREDGDHQESCDEGALKEFGGRC